MARYYAEDAELRTIINYRAKDILTQWSLKERVKKSGLDCRIWGAKAVFGDGCYSEYPLAELFTTYSQVVVQLVT